MQVRRARPKSSGDRSADGWLGRSQHDSRSGSVPELRSTARISIAEYLRDMQKMGVQFSPRRPILFVIIPPWISARTNFSSVPKKTKSGRKKDLKKSVVRKDQSTINPGCR